MDIVFLGINDAGWEIYEWLCDRDDVTVRALVTTPEQLDLVSSINPHIVVAAGYQHIVPEDVLEIPDEGCINIHPGYLPHARGFNPNVWSIVEGLPVGATIHYMDESIDTGDIIARRRVECGFEDTGKSVYRRIERACIDLFKDLWPAVEAGEVETMGQSETSATYHYKSDFLELCQIGSNEVVEAKELIDRLRALTFSPFNNAYMQINDERYYLEIDITPESEVEDVNRDGTINSY